MKKLRLLTIIIILLPCVIQTSSASGVPEDRWLHGSSGYARAVELQRELKVPLVVYFYTDWCPYCHALDNEYLTAAPVRQFLGNVVKVRVNPERGAAERQLAKQYGITGYPSFFVVGNSSAKPLNVHPFRRGRPNLTPAEFAGACEQAASFSASTVNRPASSTPATSQPKVKAQIVEVAPVVVGPTGPLPPLETILANYVAAIGGRDAQRRITSRVSKGRVDVPGVSFGGKVEIYTKAPNKSLTMMAIEPGDLLEEGFDGRTHWIRTPKGVEFAKDADRVRLIDFDFYWDTKLPELYSRLRVVRKTKDSFRNVYVVEAVSRGASPEILYFEVESGLLVRRDVTRKGPEGWQRAEIYLNDWREIDGIKLPFKVTQIFPQMRIAVTFEEFKHNVPIDDARFRP